MRISMFYMLKLQGSVIGPRKIQEPNPLMDSEIGSLVVPIRANYHTTYFSQIRGSLAKLLILIQASLIPRQMQQR